MIIWTNKKLRDTRILDKYESMPKGWRKRRRPKLTWTQTIAQTMRKRGLEDGVKKDIPDGD